MKNSNRKTRFAQIIGGALLIIFGFLDAQAQSTSQAYPTAISSGELSGKIAARDLGDSRLTSYYYFFNGTQGDVFINIKTSNLDGDIDVFAAENLRPLTKITVFSDVPTNETGRVIYLRKPEKLILRIEGRTPNEQPAVFNLKFAGSFVPAQAVADAFDATDLPEIKSANQTGARVNSVGTIIEAEPTTKPVETAATEPRKNRQASETAETETSETSAPVKSPNKAPKKNRPKNTKNVKPAAVENETAEKNIESEPPVRKTPAKRNKTTVRAERAAESEADSNIKNRADAANSLENVRLRIELKDGTKIERPMSDVLRVGVDKGVLTLITKGGAISRYSILDVAKMTIE